MHMKIDYSYNAIMHIFFGNQRLILGKFLDHLTQFGRVVSVIGP